MSPDTRIKYTKRLGLGALLSLYALRLPFLVLLVFINCVTSFEYKCDPNSSKKCFCDSGPDGTNWEIQCPAAFVEVHPITLKVTPLSDSSARLDVFCNDPKQPEIPTHLLHGVNFGKDADEYNVTDFRINYCKISSAQNPNMLKDFFTHINLNLGNLVTFKFKPSPHVLNHHFPHDLISSLHHVEVLDLSQLNLTSVPDLSSLQSLKELYLKENLIHTIPKHAFNSTQNLIRLDLNLNNLTEITENTFPTSLKDINLAKNSIERVNHASFSKLIQLQSLDLTWNPLTAMEPNSFLDLDELRFLFIDSAKFTQFPVFENLSKLIEIRISYRDPTRINIQSIIQNDPRPESSTSSGYVLSFHAIVKNLPSLKKIAFTHDGLTEFPTLENLPNLTELKLSGNRIKTIPVKIFKEFPLLTLLDLNNNEISILNDIEAPNLETLDLGNNLLETISGTVFSELKKLKTLKIKNNKLRYIDTRAFVFQTELNVLDLSKNQLSFEMAKPTSGPDVPSSDVLFGYNGVFDYQTPLRHCTRLTRLDLSYNQINNIFGDWKLFFGKLRTLNLSHNKLTRLEATDLSVSAPDLNLDLSFNEISTVSMVHADFLIDGAATRKLTVIMDGNPLNCDCELVSFKTFSLKGVYFQYSNLTCQQPPRLENMQFSKVLASDLICQLDESAGCPFICTCWKVPANKTIVVDCSYRNLTDPFTNVHSISGRWAQGYNYAINLAGNDISDLNGNHTKNISPNITRIDLSDNELLNLAFLSLLSNNNVTEFSLAENDFSCNDCEFHKMLRSHFKLVSDYNNVSCLVEEDEDSGRKVRRYLYEMKEEDICPQQLIAAELQGLIIGMSILLVALIIFIAVYFRYGWALRAYLYSKGLGCCFSDDSEEDTEKIYDAFVSYSHKDEDWVLSQLVTRLEEQEGFKLCLHFRDWTPGDWIPDQIVRSVDKSRRTVVILSKHFVESIWSRLEFKAAHSQALSEKANRLILVLMDDDLKDQDVHDEDLRVYMKMNTYLKYGDPWFWHKLKYALPHRKPVSAQANFFKQQQRERAIQLDKLRAKMENTIA